MRPDHRDGQRTNEPQPVWAEGEGSSDQQRGGSAEPSPSAPPAPAGDAGDVERDLNSLLADAEAEKDEYLELAKRTKADFENFRKRMAAEVQGAQLRGRIEVAREVIEAVDNLERALESAGDGESLAAGVEMVLGSLRETLARNGVEPVDPKGEKFDPTQHEAISTQPVEGAEPGTVVEVLQKGYTLGDQLVRPARVVVSA
jgi:molecular chaperone GrpE